MSGQTSRWFSGLPTCRLEGSCRRPANGRLKTAAVAAGLWLLHLGVQAADITVSAAASLTKAGAWEDDGQIDDLRLVRMGVLAEGAVRVRAEEKP